MKRKTVLVEITIPEEWDAANFVGFDLWGSWCEANEDSFPEMLTEASYRIIEENVGA